MGRISTLALSLLLASGCAPGPSKEGPPDATVHLLGGAVVPFTVNGISVGASPNLQFPGCDGGSMAYGPTDAGGDASFGCVSAGGGVEAGADGQIFQSSGGSGVWNTMSGECSITPGGVVSCDGGVGNLIPGTSPQVLMTTTGPVASWETMSGDGTLNATGVLDIGQLTGSTSTVNVISGTALTFLTSGHTSSAGGRLNFTGEVADNILEYHYAGTDYVALNTDGGGNLFLGVGAIPQIFVDAATDIDLTAGGTSMFVLGAGSYTSNSFGVNASGFDQGGGSGLLDLAPVTTTPTALPSTHTGIYTASGQLTGLNSNGITWPYELTGATVIQQTQAPSTSAGSGSAGNGLTIIAQAGQPATGASNAGGAGAVLLARSSGGGNSALANGGNAGNGEFGAGAGGAATGGTGNGGAGGDAILFGGAGGTTTGGSAGAAGSVRVRLAGVGGSDYLVVGSQTTSTGSDNFTTIERAGSTRWLMGSVVGATTWAALYGPVTPSPSNHALLNDGTNTGLNSTGQTRLSSSGTAEAFADASGVTIGNGTTADYGGLVGGLSLGVAGTTPTGLPTSAIGLYATSGQRLGINGTGITWPAISTGLITIQQLTLASTSAGSGAIGDELDVVAQPGQPATGASNAGGTGGVSKYQSGAGGNSALAAGGAGGVGYFGAGNGGNATGGSGNGGAGGDAIVYSGNGGTSSGGTAGATGALHLRVGGQTAGNDVVVLGGGVSASTNQGTGLGLQSTSFTISNTTGNNTPTYAVTQFPIITIATVTIGSGCILTLPNVAGGYWLIDVSAVTFTNSLTVKSGTGTCGAAISAISTTDQILEVVTYGSNKCSLRQ